VRNRNVIVNTEWIRTGTRRACAACKQSLCMKQHFRTGTNAASSRNTYLRNTIRNGQNGIILYDYVMNPKRRGRANEELQPPAV
jgi:hypothetical protein